MRIINRYDLGRITTPKRLLRIFQFLLIALWVILIYLIIDYFWKNKDLIFPYYSNIIILHLLIAFLFYLGSFFFAIWGWSSIINKFGEGISWWKNVQIYCATLVARRIPGTIWYIGGRLIFYELLGLSKTKILVSSGVELVVIFLSGVLVGIPLISFSGRMSIPSQLILVSTGIMLGSLLVYPLSKRYSRKKWGFDILERVNLKTSLFWIILYGLMWIFGGLMLFELMTSLSLVNPSEMPFIIGAWTIAGTAGLLTFFLPSAFGATELALAFLLSQFLPLPVAGVIAIIMRLLTLFFELIISMITYPFLRRQPFLQKIKG